MKYQDCGANTTKHRTVHVDKRIGSLHYKANHVISSTEVLKLDMLIIINPMADQPQVTSRPPDLAKRP